MEVIVYIDAFFFVNFVMNVILLILFKRIYKQKSSFVRIIFSAAIGGAGACLVIVWPLRNMILRFLFLYVVISMLMMVIAFSYRGFGALLIQVIKFYFISFFVGGFLQFLYHSLPIRDLIRAGITNVESHSITFLGLMGAGILMVLLLPVIIRIYGQMSRQMRLVYPVTLWQGENHINGKGFLDTGNSLRDPISGKPVIVAEYKVLKPLLTIEQQEYITHFSMSDTGTSIASIKWIPYHALGNQNGFLLGVMVDGITIEIGSKSQQIKNILVGLYQGALSVNEDYQFILHEEYLSTNY